MAKAVSLSEPQLALLRVLWAREEATVAEVREALREEGRPLASTTVATMLARLEKKGAVRRRTEGRQYVYRAALAERDVRRSMVRELTARLFGGDPSALVSHLVREGEIDARELARLRRRLGTHQTRGGPRGS